MWTENVEEATEEILKKMTELTVNQMMTDEQTTRDPEMPLMTFKSRNDKKLKKKLSQKLTKNLKNPNYP